MPDKKLTDNEIVKALERCSTATCITNKCPYENMHNIPKCTTQLTKDALDLINRLMDKNKAYKHYYDECCKELKQAHAENEKLTDKIESISLCYEEEIGQAKKENEKLKEQFRFLDIECERLEKANESQKAEIESLKKRRMLNLLKQLDVVKVFKDEAVKEFADRLCEDRVANDPVVIAVKCELKEMVGDA